MGAGVSDGGQVAKRLRRLADLGLAVNRNDGQKPGGCNAWRLTAAGERAAKAAERAAESR